MNAVHLQRLYVTEVISSSLFVGVIMEGKDVAERIIWTNIVGLTLSWVIWNPFQLATMTYWQIFLLALGATPPIIAMISAVSEITLSISRIPGGYLADKIGRRILIVSMTYVISLVYLIMYFATRWEHILIASIINNIALFYQPALNAIIADSLPKRRRGFGFSITSTIPGIANIFAPYIALIYVTKYGVVIGTRQLLLLSCLTGLIAATVRLITLRETIKSENFALNKIGSDIVIEYRETIKLIFRVMKFLLIGLAFAGIASGLAYLSQLYALNYLAISKEGWAYIQIASITLFLVLPLPFSILVDKVGRKLPIVTAALLASVSYFMMAIAPVGERAIQYLFASAILGSIAGAMNSVALSAAEADLISQEIRGKGYAMIGLINTFVVALAQLTSGLIYISLGPRVPFLLAAMFSLLAFLVFLRISETLRGKPPTISTR